MSEMNYDILIGNIRSLLRNRNMTQQQFAEILGMSQANVSKALNPNDKRHFTLEQIYAISQYFGISIDELVGNTTSAELTTKPKSVLTFLVTLLCKGTIRTISINEEETVYKPYLNDHLNMDCEFIDKTVLYHAFYLPDYWRISDFTFDEYAGQELHFDYCESGNESDYISVNAALNELLPIIEIYRQGKISENTFKDIFEGYLDRLS